MRTKSGRNPASSIDPADKAAFHWNRDEVKRVLCEIQDNRLPGLLLGKEGHFADSVVPLAVKVAMFIPRLTVGSEEKWTDLVNRVSKFQGGLFQVADAAYTLVLLDEGVLRPEYAP